MLLAQMAEGDENTYERKSTSGETRREPENLTHETPKEKKLRKGKLYETLQHKR